MPKEKQVNINNGEDFYAHELSMHFNPTQFIFDFKCITPRVDVRSTEQAVLNIKHNVVITDVYHVKKIHEMMAKIIKDYEKEFGRIEKPKSIKKLEEKMKKQGKDVKSTEEAPNYFG